MSGKAPSTQTPEEALNSLWANDSSALARAILANPDAFGLNNQSANDNNTLLKAQYQAGNLSPQQEEQYLRIHGRSAGLDPSTLTEQERSWVYGSSQPGANGMAYDGGQYPATTTGGATPTTQAGYLPRTSYPTEFLQQMGRAFGDANAFTTHPQADAVWNKLLEQGRLDRHLRQYGDFVPPQSGGSSGGGGYTPPPTGGGGGYTPPVGGGGGGGATPQPPGATPPSGGAGGAGGGLYGPPIPFGGYQGPNASLYAEQFGNLKAGGDAYQRNALAAAIRREAQENQNANAEPWQADWSWANLPQVRTNSQQPGESNPYTWQFNSAYNFAPGKSSNADMLRAVMSNNQFTDSDRGWFNRAMADSKMDNDFYWSSVTNPQDIISNFTGYNAENMRRMTDAVNLMFTRSDLATPEGGGPAAPPPGYAAPR